MASGLSLVLRHLKRDHPIQPREKRERDRSLSGKARIRARRSKRVEPPVRRDEGTS